MENTESLVRVAKRENNQKRNYLVVNPLQGKHVPVEPGRALELFGRLGRLLQEAYGGEQLLLVGFAETATAIGAALAVLLDSQYIQTTREQVGDGRYFHFTESHSHATEQKLVKGDMDAAMEGARRVVFVEDEVTTGNTVLNIIRLMRKEYGEAARYGVASLLNGMEEDVVEEFGKQGIDLHYLEKTDHRGYPALAECWPMDGSYYDCREGNVFQVEFFQARGYLDARRLTEGGAYQRACNKLWVQIARQFSREGAGRVLVLGTEEFMYPALHVAYRLEQAGLEVRFHAATRSPILVSSHREYPLHARYTLRSVYDDRRTTYLYDLCRYDTVLLITDAPLGQGLPGGAGGGAVLPPEENQGVESILRALRQSGNEKVFVVRWGR